MEQHVSHQPEVQAALMVGTGPIPAGTPHSGSKRCVLFSYKAGVRRAALARCRKSQRDLPDRYPDLKIPYPIHGTADAARWKGYRVARSNARSVQGCIGCTVRSRGRRIAR